MKIAGILNSDNYMEFSLRVFGGKAMEWSGKRAHVGEWVEIGAGTGGF